MTLASIRPASIPGIAVLFAAAHCLLPAAAPGAEAVAGRVASAALDGFTGPVPNLIRSRMQYFNEGLDAGEAALAYALLSGGETADVAADAFVVQIALLRSLFPTERTPYMAYRIGVLARGLIDMSFPLPPWGPIQDSRIRERFLADIEAHPADLAARPAAAKTLSNPARELRGSFDRGAGWTGPVRAQYRAGRGYNIVVRQAAAGSAQTASSLVRDLLATIGSERKGRAAAGARDAYYGDACGFYLRRGMRGEAAAAYRMIAGRAHPPRLETVEEAVDEYGRVRRLLALEAALKDGGVDIPSSTAEAQRQLYLEGLAAFTARSVESGWKESARTALAILLREGYRPDRTLAAVAALYGLGGLRDMDLQENAWRVYREANRLEAVAANARVAGKPFAANDALMRAAALYAAIPEGAGGIWKSSRLRIGQVSAAMREIPPEALASEELFRTAVGSITEGEIDAAARALAMSERFAPGDRAVQDAAREAEAIRLFSGGRELYEAGKYGPAAKKFRAIVERHPRSPLAKQAQRMLDLDARRKAEQRGALLLLLRGAYEASFVDDASTVFERCGELLAARPDYDLRDRAQLLIALAWYESGQRGYQDIARVFRDLLKNNVLEVKGPDLVLRKRIDFYFGLKDAFPGIEISRLRGSLAGKLDLGAARGDGEGAGDAEDTLAKARDVIQTATDLIEQGEAEKIEMHDARSLVDEATRFADDASELIGSGNIDDAGKRAGDALDKAEEAREEAEKLLGVGGEKREEAKREIDEAEEAVNDAERAVKETEDRLDAKFDKLRDDLDEAMERLKDANDLFGNAEYDEAKEKALEAAEKARKLKEDAEEQLKEGEGAAEQEEEERQGGE